MNVEAIIQREGYREKDLKPEDRDVIKWLRYLESHFEGYLAEYEDLDDDPLYKRVYNSIARDVIRDITEHVHADIGEIQIALAEGDE